MHEPDISTFQLHIIRATAKLNNEPGRTVGRDIQDAISDSTNTEIQHPRIYQNINELVDMGLMTKSEINGRTNQYDLTERGDRVLREWAEYLDVLPANDAD